MNIYHIIALPNEENLTRLNNIRHYLYTNGFRYSVDPPKNDVHITLAQINSSDDEAFIQNNLRDLINNELKDIKKFEIESDHITNNKKTPDAKYPNGNVWIALYFKDNILKKMAQNIDGILKGLNISTTEDYIAPFRTNSSEDIYDLTANHMNLCNYARPERAQKAKEYILQTAPKNFFIDKIALRDAKGKILWKINLGG